MRTTGNRTKNFSIFGSRALFLLLVPWLLLGVAVFSGLAYGQIEERKLGGFLMASVLAVCCLCGLLIGISPKRFGWTVLFVTVPAGSVAAGYVTYFCDTFFVQGQPLTPSSRRSDATPWNALLGFLFIGLPCLVHTVQGIRKWLCARSKDRTQ